MLFMCSVTLWCHRIKLCLLFFCNIINKIIVLIILFYWDLWLWDLPLFTSLFFVLVCCVLFLLTVSFIVSNNYLSQELLYSEDLPSWWWWIRWFLLCTKHLLEKFVKSIFISLLCSFKRVLLFWEELLAIFDMGDIYIITGNYHLFAVLTNLL